MCLIMHDMIKSAQQELANGIDAEDSKYDTYFIFNKYVQDTTKSVSKHPANDNTLDADDSRS